MNFIPAKKIKGFTQIILFQVISITPIFAASVDFNDYGTYLTDNISGLDWLDVTISTNQSYRFVTENMVRGGLYAGWRHASAAEFDDLVSNYTGESSRNGLHKIYGDKIDGLVTMLGSTLDVHHIHFYGNTYDNLHGYAEGKGWDYTYGFISDKTDLGEHWLAMLYDDNLYDWRPDMESARWQHHKDSQDSYSFGSYLVRNTVKILETPIPATIWLFAPGLIGLIGLSCRNKIKLVSTGKNSTVIPVR